MSKLVDLKAFLIASTATLLTLLMILIGSRRLQNFDAALIAYLFGTLFAVFGIVYRYTVWIQRPPTRVYFVSSLKTLFSKDGLNFVGYTLKDFLLNIIFQRFIIRRGKYRGFAHLFMAIGCFLAFCITIPLTFGWIHFTLVPGSGMDPAAPKIYTAHFFGFDVMNFPVKSIIGFLTFGALNWCSILVIIGATYFLQRRLKDPGLIATQTFEGDILPLLLLILVSLTGLGLTLDYEFMHGKAYEFMAVTHAFFVIVFLVWMPFGKFFHIIQRPAQIGAHIYKEVGRKQGMQQCKFTHKEYTTKLHVADLKKITKETGFNLENKDGESILDYSPEGKRDLLAIAHFKARRQSGDFFG
ncbi:MFS transporter [Sphingobacterium prati]|uniref:MFS transporter n=1 Tax=Sphingobacterium prati TaxID=2737006 RepID=UPI001557C91C|nr:MFS transporter [Sphingobacterium prati]NPE46820.1 MFS transporter [Sphingobacterium prati]